MRDTTWMIEAACDADKQRTLARAVMTLEDCTEKYAEYLENEK